MELEKDERVYGGHDAAVRADMPAQGARALAGDPQAVHRRSPTSPRSAAGRCMSMLMSAVPNNELRNGYHVQFVDEIRHTGMQMALARWYAKNVPDPAGWNLGPQGAQRLGADQPGAEHAHRTSSSATRSSARSRCRWSPRRRSPTSCSSPPRTWPRATATSRCRPRICSVQSDEARHISNGYATLLTVLQDDHNAPLIERDLQQAFWINHAFIDVFSAVVIEYFSRDRSDPESLPGQVGPLGARRLAPRLHHEARQARARHPAGHVRARARADGRRRCTTATRSSRSPPGR